MEIKTTNEQINFIESICDSTGESVLVYLVHNDLEITEENILDIPYDNLKNIFDEDYEDDFLLDNINDYVNNVLYNIRRSDYSYLENYIDKDRWIDDEYKDAKLEDYFSIIDTYIVCNTDKDTHVKYKYCEE